MATSPTPLAQPVAVITRERVQETRELLATVQPGDRFMYPGLFPAFAEQTFIECTKIEGNKFLFNLRFADTPLGELAICLDNNGALRVTVEVK